MKIALNMIMKDEEKVLLRLLNSVCPVIDTYVVIDTGSTDNSKKVVKDFFDSKGIDGVIYDHPFKDFEDARNFALSKLKDYADYGLLIDCDEELILKDNFNKDQLKEALVKADLGVIPVTYGSHRFGRTSFATSKKDLKWVGKVHEVLIGNNFIPSSINLDSIEVLVRPDGNSWSEGTREKYLKHAEILKKHVEETNEPRSVFYLAQSYKDAGENELAIKWYKKRVDQLNGFYEERYYAQFMVGLLYQTLNKPYIETFTEYMKCSLLDDLRAEHLLNAVIILYNNGHLEAAQSLCEQVFKKHHNKSPYPNRVLFLDYMTYDHKISNMLNHLNNLLAEKQKEKELDYFGHPEK